MKRQAAGFNPAAVALGLGVAGAILVLRRLKPGWPGMLSAWETTGLNHVSITKPRSCGGSK